ncbi:nitroreductase family deazaflavin-dependent oxidoreductase [Aeromicrobium sp. 636]|uniref:Nitroreductase family deazaflavin-dependent oxidoreductase n=1 Tax=Aeromicrobium senzhongii TaxID=2663859 RepID=A0A8I0K1R8_9ACTN|nr:MULTISPECIES: nitroreductase/quinone reductase family protein [Aeromicrobium]MBC9227243.1 nitroreductase family deazaflavin-dependent oxidoreductase [Aeromicrobium senzhongii]MCQ3999342.1 nitroreductase family deazaflavin-dependent oxidoreductase [Aeromicrobium sp. 636]
MSFEAHGGTRGGKTHGGPLTRLVNRFVARRARRSATASMGPMKLAVLTTIGARSGLPRENPVGWFPGGDGSYLVVASANGARNNPAWFHNIAAHPDDVTLEIGPRKIAVSAEQLHGAEREAALRSIIEAAPQFAGYNDKTDRVIPVVRLTERPAPPS